jgi:hypothetical protein
VSNVLIGIIGVILFIGLALAGALILGDDFKSSQADSLAARYGTSMSQMEAATAMMRLKTGRSPVVGDFEAELIPRFIKLRPALGDGVFAGWRASDNSGTPVPPTFTAVVTPPTQTNLAACLSYAQQVGQISATSSTVPTAASAPAIVTGCFQMTQAWGVDPAGTVFFFKRL